MFLLYLRVLCGCPWSVCTHVPVFYSIGLFRCLAIMVGLLCVSVGPGWPVGTCSLPPWAYRAGLQGYSYTLRVQGGLWVGQGHGCGECYYLVFLGMSSKLAPSLW